MSSESISSVMATGADLPSELLVLILRQIGDYDVLAHVETAARQEMIQQLATCALTCRYWADHCRPMIFTRVRVRCLEALRALSLIISSTPIVLPPVTKYICSWHLLQRLDARPWLHNCALRVSDRLPNLPYTITHITIVGSSSVEGHPLPSTTRSPRVTNPLPRTLPSICYQCDSLTLERCHFRTVHELRRYLRQFAFLIRGKAYLIDCSCDELYFPRLDGKLSLPFRAFTVTTSKCLQTVEMAWSAFTSMGDPHCHFPTLPNSPKIRVMLAPPDHRCIFNLSKLLFDSVISSGLAADSGLSISTGPSWSWPLDEGARIYVESNIDSVCEVSIVKHATDRGKATDLALGFHTNATFTPEWYGLINKTTVDHVTQVRIRLNKDDLWAGGPLRLKTALSYPWDNIVAQLARLPLLSKINICCSERDQAVRFVEARREAFSRLRPRVQIVMMYSRMVVSPPPDWESTPLIRVDEISMDFDTFEEIG